ncbi:hypothetical protein [Pendulispora albinea]|uniref:Uncharacterized protein n=1 Tax=Pendulispora albinea TaxID=2741071 RepID=A0ABZ2LRV9_9BACT
MYASILHYVRSARVSRLVGAGLAASIAFVVGGVGCDQSTPLCRTGTGTYTVKYTLVSGTGDCSKLDTDVIYVNSYNDVGEDGRPNLERISAALAPGFLAGELDRVQGRLGLKPPVDPDPNADHHHWAWGHFTSSEPSGNFCVIDNAELIANAAVQEYPAVPAVPGSPGELKDPADKCTYAKPPVKARAAEPPTKHRAEFTNWRVFFTPAHAGNQFSVHLKYTIEKEGKAAETCEYDGRAALFGLRQSCDKGDGKTKLPEACDPEGHPDIKQLAAKDTCDKATGEVTTEYVEGQGLGTGSGVDPDFPVECDDSLVCVIKGPVPALK